MTRRDVMLATIFCGCACVAMLTLFDFHERVENVIFALAFACAVFSFFVGLGYRR